MAVYEGRQTTRQGPVGMTATEMDASIPRYEKSGTSTSPAGSGLDLSDLAKLYASQKGRRSIEDIYMENRRYNKMLTDEAYERSLGWDMEGPAGSTSFDKDTKEMLAEFTPEMQQLYDGWLRAEQRAGEELGAYDMDERTLKQIGMFDAASAERDRQAKLAMDEQIFAQGIGGTQGYYNQMTLGEQVNQRRLQEALRSREMAMGERNLLSAEQLAFGNAAIDSPRTLFRQAELGLQAGQGSHTGVNMEGNTLASMALADAKAGYWSGLLGGMSQYGGSGSPSASGSGLLKGLLNPFGSSMMTTNKGSLA